MPRSTPAATRPRGGGEGGRADGGTSRRHPGWGVRGGPRPAPRGEERRWGARAGATTATTPPWAGGLPATVRAMGAGAGRWGGDGGAGGREGGRRTQGRAGGRADAAAGGGEPGPAGVAPAGRRAPTPAPRSLARSLALLPPPPHSSSRAPARRAPDTPPRPPPPTTARAPRRPPRRATGGPALHARTRHRPLRGHGARDAARPQPGGKRAAADGATASRGPPTGHASTGRGPARDTASARASPAGKTSAGPGPGPGDPPEAACGSRGAPAGTVAPETSPSASLGLSRSRGRRGPRPWRPRGAAGGDRRGSALRGTEGPGRRRRGPLRDNPQPRTRGCD